MRIIAKMIVVSLVLFWGIPLSGMVFAGDYESTPAETIEISELGDPVSGNTLNGLSGGQSMQIDTIDMLVNNMNVQSDLANNVLYSATTGANVVSNDAFSTASGISTVIQNSGNQVIINSALILNLRVQ